MYTQEEITEATDKLIKFLDNPVAVLAKKSELSRPTVSKFFNRKVDELRPSSVKKLFKLSLQIIKEEEDEYLECLKQKNSSKKSIKNEEQKEMNL